MTEILLCAMPTDQVLSVPGAKQRLLLELLQMLLNKVLADGALLGKSFSRKKIFFVKFKIQYLCCFLQK